MKVKVLTLDPIMTVAESDAMAGKFLKESDCKLLLSEDVDVYDKESGKCIAKFRKGIIPGQVQQAAYNNLLKAATPTNNRGLGSGSTRKKVVKKDGTIARKTVADVVWSGIAGYFDRNPRFPYCRTTAFNQHHFDKFKKAYPIVKLVDNVYKELMPEYYKKQKKVADATSPDFIIPGTVFTTVTVNKNYETAVHKDSGDFKGGFGNLVALRKGTYTGCHFTLVRWGVGFDMQNGDVLMTDVHQWHGNTPMIKHSKDATRLSLVMYYREKMMECGTADEELERAKEVRSNIERNKEV